MNSKINTISNALTDIDKVNTNIDDIIKYNILQLGPIYQNTAKILGLNNIEDMIIRNKVFVPYAKNFFDRKHAMLVAFTEVPSLTNLCKVELNNICPFENITPEDKFIATLNYSENDFETVLEHYGYLYIDPTGF